MVLPREYRHLLLLLLLLLLLWRFSRLKAGKRQNSAKWICAERA
jgi:hypothetical protein